MKKKRPASSYLLMLLSAIAVILILLIIYFTVRQQNVSTSTQTEIQTASAREEGGSPLAMQRLMTDLLPEMLRMLLIHRKAFRKEKAPALCQ